MNSILDSIKKIINPMLKTATKLCLAEVRKDKKAKEKLNILEKKASDFR